MTSKKKTHEKVKFEIGNKWHAWNDGVLTSIFKVIF